jgi:hypothetical protein
LAIWTGALTPFRDKYGIVSTGEEIKAQHRTHWDNQEMGERYKGSDNGSPPAYTSRFQATNKAFAAVVFPNGGCSFGFFPAIAIYFKGNGGQCGTKLGGTGQLGGFQRVSVPLSLFPAYSERATGFEPATSSLGSWHSTTELHPQNAPEVKSEASSNQDTHRVCRQYPISGPFLAMAREARCSKHQLADG